MIALLLLVTLFPFYYMAMLSVRPIGDVLLQPDSLLPDFSTLIWSGYGAVLRPVEDAGQGFVSLLRNSGVMTFVPRLSKCPVWFSTRPR